LKTDKNTPSSWNLLKLPKKKIKLFDHFFSLKCIFYVLRLSSLFLSVFFSKIEFCKFAKLEILENDEDYNVKLEQFQISQTNFELIRKEYEQLGNIFRNDIEQYHSFINCPFDLNFINSILNFTQIILYFVHFL